MYSCAPSLGLIILPLCLHPNLSCASLAPWHPNVSSPIFLAPASHPHTPFLSCAAPFSHHQAPHHIPLCTLPKPCCMPHTHRALPHLLHILAHPPAPPWTFPEPHCTTLTPSSIQQQPLLCLLACLQAVWNLQLPDGFSTDLVMGNWQEIVSPSNRGIQLKTASESAKIVITKRCSQALWLHCLVMEIPITTSVISQGLPTSPSSIFLYCLL